MTDYCATGWARPITGQTYIYDATQSKLVPHSIAGVSSNINHTTFDLAYRNSFLNVVEVNSGSNPVTMIAGYVYITTDNSSPVNFVMPSAGAGLNHGDNIKIAGKGSAGFTVSTTGPQFFSFNGSVFHSITSTIAFNQISFCYDAFSTNNFWYLFAMQGNFVLT